MKFAFLLLGPLFMASSVVAVFLYWYGRRLSQTHRETSSVVLPGTPQQVWDALVERRSVSQYGQQIDSVIEQQSPPHRMVRRALDAGMPFGGTWTFELEPTCQGTRLTVIEEGFIRPPILRAIVHLFIGTGKAQQTLLASLG